MSEINTTPPDTPTLDEVGVPFLDDKPAEVTEIEKQPMPVEKTAEEKKTSTRPPHYFQQKYPYTGKGDLGGGEVVSLPATFDKETQQALQDAPYVEMVGTDDQRDWAETLNSGLALNTYLEGLEPALADAESMWAQSIDENGRELMGGSPRLRPANGAVLQGDAAAIRMMSFLGLGTVYQAPMWHSGFWVTFRPCTEGEWLELNRTVMSDNITFGRSTYGLAYSNMTVYSVERVARFALEHVYDLSVKADEINTSNLFDHLAPQDLPCFIHGFMCSVYAQGFHYRRACSLTPDKCNHIEEEILNLQKLHWVNTRALTPWQRVHMADRQSRSRTLDQVKRYREEMSKLQPSAKTVRLGEKEFQVLLGVPSATDYFNQGHRWISGIVEMVDAVLGTDASTQDRNRHIASHAKASTLRQFQHWVKELRTDSFVINKPEDIERQLSILSGNDSVRAFLMKTITDYINATTISLIGIPAYVCPKCGTSHEATDPKKHAKNILPLDVVNLFFVLHTRRIERILKR